MAQATGMLYGVTKKKEEEKKADPKEDKNPKNAAPEINKDITPDPKNP